MAKLWTPQEDNFLLENYKTMTMVELSEGLSRSIGQVRGRKERLNLSKYNNQNRWTSTQMSILRQFYAVAGSLAPINLRHVAQLIGKDVPNVCRKAAELGLPTNPSRSKANTPPHQYALKIDMKKGRPSPRRGIPVWQDGPHPRGMLGKSHTPKAREQMSSRLLDDYKTGKRVPPVISQSRRDNISRLMTERMKGGSAYSRTRKGWHEVGGQRIFCKSAWEMGYANYLQFLKEQNQIKKWEYEPDTFWFEKIRRGVRSYTPDFKVFNLNGSIEYHEVKGWMDSKSKTKLNRMRIYHPSVKMVLVDSSVYKALKRQLPALFAV